MTAHRYILIAESEQPLADTLVDDLQRAGYQVSCVGTGREALAAARSRQPDAVLVDALLPEVDGLEVCRRLRSESTVPVILLTATDDAATGVLGLEMGADAYVVKPFSLRELRAQIQAILRRVDMDVGTLGEVREAVVQAGPLRLHPRSRTAYRGGTSLRLLPREFDLLLYLARNPGVVLPRRELVERVWGAEYPVKSRSLDVHIRRLRMKIEDDPDRPDLIQTVHKTGYLLSNAEATGNGD